MDISVALFVLSILFIVILGPIITGVTYSLLKRRAISRQELQTLQDNIAQIKSDIADIKEQFADFIIGTH